MVQDMPFFEGLNTDWERTYRNRTLWCEDLAVRCAPFYSLSIETDITPATKTSRDLQTI